MRPSIRLDDDRHFRRLRCTSDVEVALVIDSSLCARVGGSSEVDAHTALHCWCQPVLRSARTLQKMRISLWRFIVIWHGPLLDLKPAIVQIQLQLLDVSNKQVSSKLMFTISKAKTLQELFGGCAIDSHCDTGVATGVNGVFRDLSILSKLVTGVWRAVGPCNNEWQSRRNVQYNSWFVHSDWSRLIRIPINNPLLRPVGPAVENVNPAPVPTPVPTPVPRPVPARSPGPDTCPCTQSQRLVGSTCEDDYVAQLKKSEETATM
jgi:hypothetical protein